MSDKENKKATTKKPQVTKKDLEVKIKLLENRLKEERNNVINLEKQVKELNDSYVTKIKEKTLQAQSLLNIKEQELREKTEKELEESKKYGIFRKLDNLIKTLQTFEMVLSAPVSDPTLQAYLQGFNMVKENYKEGLSDIGVHEIVTKVGDVADASLHEAMEAEENPNYKEGQIIKILNKGYRLHERVIQPTKVIVAK